MIDLLTVGRISVDLYSRELNAGFDDPQTFAKSVGGSPTNVAVAAARLGNSAAVATKVGADPFGAYIRERLQGWGVDTRFVGTHPEAMTPLAFAALDPPEDPQILFYRWPFAPDTTMLVDDVSVDVVRECRVLWMSLGALATGTTADAGLTWMSQRARQPHVVIDLDYRPSMWSGIEAARVVAQQALALSTVAVGNRQECFMAVGEEEPDAAADALLAAGVSLAIVKMGGAGVLLATADGRWRVPPTPVEVVCGLGAGDAFGGALVHGLLRDWDVPTIGRYANAAGAFVAAQLTCADAMPTVADLESLVASTEETR
jgi:5-dehydro-2-deoxygluconokinase